MIACGKTDVGKIRDNNEDSYYVSVEPIGKLDNLFIVADGMGGHNAGEIASRDSIDFFCQYLKEGKVDLDYEGIILDGVFFANAEIYKKSKTEKDKEGMGTTFSVCSLKDNTLHIGHVGDSRVYKISNNTMEQLTVDHTYVNEMVTRGLMTKEQAEVDPHRNFITRVVGVDPTVMVDYFEVTVEKGDKLLLCSDGLTGMVSDIIIKNIVENNSDIEECVSMLIEEALNNGGQDNITVILILV